MHDVTDAALVLEPDLAEIVNDYRRSLDVMSAAVRTADPGCWDDQSPCEHWSARQVLGHAVTFIRNVVALAGDGDAPDFGASVDLAAVAGSDPAAVWQATRKLIEDEVLTRPDRLVAVRMTPLGAEMPIATFLTFQGMDPVVHGWDIATTTNGSIHIPDDLAVKYVKRFTPVSDQVRASGRLGPALTGGTTASDQLLDFCGRTR
jgi:uncharacterized protein (TIGR03086 family)